MYKRQPTPSLAHSYSLLEALPRVPETPPKFAQSVVTPTLGTVPILAPSMLGQLSLVSATHTTLTVPLILRTVARASVVAQGAAASTATCTATSYLVPVANTEVPVKPPAGTMPTPSAIIPTQTSLVGSVLPAATLVNVPPVVTSASAVPVVTTAQALSLIHISEPTRPY